MSIRKYTYQPPTPFIAARLAAVLAVMALAVVAAMNWRGPLRLDGTELLSAFEAQALFWTLAALALCVAGVLVRRRMRALGNPRTVVLHLASLTVPQGRSATADTLILYDSIRRIDVRGIGAARLLEVHVDGGSVCVAQACLNDAAAFDSLVDALADKLSLAEERRRRRAARPSAPASLPATADGWRVQ